MNLKKKMGVEMPLRYNYVFKKVEGLTLKQPWIINCAINCFLIHHMDHEVPQRDRKKEMYCQ